MRVAIVTTLIVISLYALVTGFMVINERTYCYNHPGVCSK